MSQEVLDSDMKNDVSSDVIIEKHQATYHFKGMDQNALADKVQQYLLGKGYKLEEGTKVRGKYGKGSKIGRILLGAFIKRFCWEIQVDQSGEKARLKLIKDAKGYVGGIIGVNQVNNEFDLLSRSIKDWHAKVNQG